MPQRWKSPLNPDDSPQQEEKKNSISVSGAVFNQSVLLIWEFLLTATEKLSNFFLGAKTFLNSFTSHK